MSETEARPGQIILAWWSAQLGDRKSGAQKTLSARLRRGDDVTVLCQKSVHDLAQRLDLRDGTRIARLVRTLAHVRTHTPGRLPRLLGTGDPPALSRLRFERLIQSDGAELETALRRAMPMVGHAANVAHLGEAILFWSDKNRTAWCFDYYGADAPKATLSEDVSR